jgi:hypothetical protein
MWHYRAHVFIEKVSFFAVFGYFDTILYKIDKKMNGSFMLRRVLQPFSKLVSV